MFIILLCIIFFPISAMAGPFGTEMMDSLEQYKQLGAKIVQIGEQNQYIVDKVPNPYPSFSKYRLIFAPNGLSKVATGKKFVNDETGAQAKELFNTLQKQLTEKYYREPDFKYVRPNYGYSWTAKLDFDTNFRKDWSKLQRSKWVGNLPDNLYSIELFIQAENALNTIVTIEFTYSNYEIMLKDAYIRDENVL